MRRLRSRRSIRARLTLTYTGLMLMVAATMVAFIYLFMRYVPTYALGDGGTTVAPVDPQPVPPSVVAALTGTAQPIRTEHDFLTTLLLASGLALVVLGCLAGLLGWIVTGRMLRPLHDIADAARRAGAGHLDHRIALPGPQDELKDLSDTIDVMLARLERSFHAHRRFAANASHELRTPLATTQAVLDVALAEPEHTDVRTLAAKLRSVNTQSIGTVDALLDLADIAENPIAGEPVALTPLIHRAMAVVPPDSTITWEGALQDGTVLGDPVLLRQLLTNLLQNAVRYNHPNGTVTVTSVIRGAQAVIRISNTGPCVPAEILPLLTEPFYRAGGRISGGHGLGLALAATIAAAHGSALSLDANPGGGLTVGISLPAAL